MDGRFGRKHGRFDTEIEYGQGVRVSKSYYHTSRVSTIMRKSNDHHVELLYFLPVCQI